MRIGVWGAGREISSFAEQLTRRLPSARIVVAAFDTHPAPGVLETLKAPAARIVSAADDDVVAALAGCDVVVRSPGVSIHRLEMQALRDAAIPVTTATALWLAECGGDGVVGVTGTKGKSTTAALIFHLARASGRTAQLAGNIGVPALDLLDSDRAEVTVVELSSYHTADLEVGPEVALVTNLFKEHTDWHGSEQVYRAEKLRLLGLPQVRVRVLNARDDQLMAAVAAADARPPVVPAQALGATTQALGATTQALGATTQGLAATMQGRLGATMFFGGVGGWDVADDAICRGGQRIVDRSELPLRGEHNALNLCAALTAIEALDIAPPSLPGSVHDFHSLPHRLETVSERDGLLWVDDSISTTPESTLAALASFADRDVVLIGGGQDRGQDYTELGRELRAAGAIVIGVPSTGSRLVAGARAAGVPATQAFDVADMQAAVAAASRMARTGTVVLLSPAAPSYDHYRDFEERGELFRYLAEHR